MADLEALKRSYDEREADGRRLAERLAEQVGELLAAERISLAVPIEHRLKSWSSVSGKVERKQLSIGHVLELGDLVGLRLILLFRRDVERVRALLHGLLHEASAEDVAGRLGTETFGYQSIHLQGKLPRAWAGLPTFRGCSDLPVEVQVRTAAQHIWAAASHVLQYKQEGSVPRDVLRSINRVSALLETVDLEFERVLDQREEYSREVDTLDGSQSLNVDILRKVLDETLPVANRGDPEDYESMLSTLLRADIRTVDQLRERIDSGLPKVLAREAELREQGKHAVVIKSMGRKHIVKMRNGTEWLTSQARRDRNVWHDHEDMINRIVAD